MYGKKKKRLSLLVAMIVLLSFSGIALAAMVSGVWTSGTCMRAFTASQELSKPTNEDWFKFYLRPYSVLYADDNYSREGILQTWVMTRDGARMSGITIASAARAAYMDIYPQADEYNTLKVRIQNYECYDTYNMRSSGEFWASY
jgi:hypothetical protein